jgi:copper chaperone CopZ
MKKFNKLMMMLSVASTIITGCDAQINNVKTENVKIYGNCSMCKKIIEKAGSIKDVAEVYWDKETKTAAISYDPSKTNPDNILQRIAEAGYDSDSFTAPDEVYSRLHGCCQYSRPGKKN